MLLDPRLKYVWVLRGNETGTWVGLSLDMVGHRARSARGGHQFALLHRTPQIGRVFILMKGHYFYVKMESIKENHHIIVANSINNDPDMFVEYCKWQM